MQILCCAKLLFLPDKTPSQLTVIPLHYEIGPPALMGVFWFLFPILTVYIINFHITYMSELNSVLVPAVVCNPVHSGEKSFPPNILKKGWKKYLSVCLPLLLPTQLSLEKWRKNFKKRLKNKLGLIKIDYHNLGWGVERWKKCFVFLLSELFCPNDSCGVVSWAQGYTGAAHFIPLLSLVAKP